MIRVGCLVFMLLLWIPTKTYALSSFICIAYHDVVETREELTYDGVTLDNLVDHFEWLKAHDYQPVSVDDIIAAHTNQRPLPERAVLLTWDDGYLSFYEYVYPLLKAYNYPAVLALVGDWMSTDRDGLVQYGTELVPRSKFMTWKQVEEVSDSGLVEIASHSYNLHTTVIASPMGDSMPAAIARVYDKNSNSYETDEEYAERIKADLRKNSITIKEKIGISPRVMVWPFGHYNALTLKLAAEVGMPLTFTLSSVVADTQDLSQLGRIYPTLNPDLKTFRNYLKTNIRPPVRHFFKVDTRDLIEPALSTESHFSIFLDRVKKLSPNMVLLSPVAQQGDDWGAIFPNSRIPTFQDRLRRISWHTGKRSQTGVYYWLDEKLFIPSASESKDTIYQFFSEMGKAGPGEGLVLVSNELAEALILSGNSHLAQMKTLQYWNPVLQKRNRQTVLGIDAQSNSAVAAHYFKALEQFQYWQPIQDVGIAVDLKRCATYSPKQLASLLVYFDFIVITVDHLNVDAIEKSLFEQIDQLDRLDLLRKCAVFFRDASQGRELVEKLRKLPEINVINWGYSIDRFLENSPSSVLIRPLMLKASFPYNVPYRPHE